jgi:general secretion pathway protein A
MYAEHFGLTQDPFSIAPDPRYLFMSDRHREALAHLLYGVSGSGAQGTGTGGGFVLLTGDIGTGKTTICRCFLEQIPANCHVAYIFNPKLTVPELLQTVCEEFHIAGPQASDQAPTVKNYIDTLNAFLLQSHAQGQSCVLIVDEAQNLSPDVLEQLRLLTNLETNERKLLQIVLIGQPELRTMLQQPELAQLAQRVIARFHLDALSEHETAQYISHRLAIAGHHGALPFDDASVRQIHQLTRGVPRRINLLCGRALLGAWAHGAERVNGSIVKKAAHEVFGAEPEAAPKRRALSAGLVLTALALIVAGGLAAARWYAVPDESAAAPHPAAVAVAASPTSAPVASTVSTAVSAPTPTFTASLTSTSTQTSTAVKVSPTSPSVEPLDDLLPLLPREPQAAWNTLATHWNLPDTTTTPCAASAIGPWECFQTTLLTVPQLRQLARPGVLKLRLENGASAYAVVMSLSNESVTLRVNGALRSVRLTALVKMWDGNYATYWRAPEGYQALELARSAPGFFAFLARQLAQIDGNTPPQPLPQSLDAPLRSQVLAFQRAHGLKPDGLPGPMTLMQIESVIASATPRTP